MAGPGAQNTALPLLSLTDSGILPNKPRTPNTPASSPCALRIYIPLTDYAVRIQTHHIWVKIGGRPILFIFSLPTKAALVLRPADFQSIPLLLLFFSPLPSSTTLLRILRRGHRGQANRVGSAVRTGARCAQIFFGIFVVETEPAVK